MPTVQFSESLRREYERLFSTCTIRPERMGEVDALVARLQAGSPRYRSVADPLGTSWGFVAVIHNTEASIDFTKHLHNGDPLTSRTVQVPAGRPKGGTPPFSWEECAGDALIMKGPVDRPGHGRSRAGPAALAQHLSGDFCQGKWHSRATHLGCI